MFIDSYRGLMRRKISETLDPDIWHKSLGVIDLLEKWYEAKNDSS